MDSPSYAAWLLGILATLMVGVLTWTAHQTLQVPLLRQRIDDLENRIESQLEDIKLAIARIEKWFMDKLT